MNIQLFLLFYRLHEIRFGNDWMNIGDVNDERAKRVWF